MSRQRFLSACASFLLLPTVWAIEPAVPVTAEWTGDNPEDNYWSDSANWLDGQLPSFDGMTVAYFPGLLFNFGDEIHIALDSYPDVAALNFDSGANYAFSADYVELTNVDFTIRSYVEVAGGFEGPLISQPSAAALDTAYGYFPSEILFDYSVNVIADNTDWYVHGSAEVEIAGTLTSSTQVRKSGTGMLLLSGYNSSALSGEVLLTDGVLGIGSSEALGNATLTIGPKDQSLYLYPGLVAVDYDQTINNAVTVTNYLSTYEDEDYQENELNFAGTVTLLDDTLIENYGGLLSFEGSVIEENEGTAVTVYADRPVLFGGITDFTGGLNVQQGQVVFLDGDSLPTAGDYTGTTSSYIGLIEATLADQTASLTEFLSRFDPTGYQGAIGFDTDPDSMVVNSYAGDLDLSGLHPDVTLGSLTRAEITGTITPAGTNYRFGGGGGELRVGSTLSDGESPRGIQVYSAYDSALTVYLNSSANSFTGPVEVANSALIFGNAPGTLPTGASLLTQQGGYIGLQDDTRTIASYLGQWNNQLAQGFIGFDSQDSSSPRLITEDIDLSGFTNSGFYLATTTDVMLQGAITLPSTATAYRFAGYKGGALTVASTLTDANETPTAVYIGDYNTSATGSFQSEGSMESRYSSVTLAGDNTYTGGTYLSNGGLIVTHDNALGTGTLSAIGGGYGFTDSLYYGEEPELYFEEYPVLRAGSVDLVLANAIELSGNLIVDTPYLETDSNFTLDGDIFGSASLIKASGGTLNLGGNNSEFSGGMLIMEGTVNIDTDTAAGSGPIAMGYGYGQTLNFNSANPTIGGLVDILDGEEFYMSTAFVHLATGTTLTIDPKGLELEFGGYISGEGALVITGEGEQSLTGGNSYTGGTTISNGATVYASGSNAFGNGGGELGTPSVTLDGATLYIDSDATFNPVNANLVFGPNGGTLGGNGRLTFDNTLQVGDNAKIAPGFSIGHLQLDGAVEFASGGGLEIELGDASNGDVIADFLVADSLAFTSTAIDPFNIFLTNEDGIVPVNFDPNESYTWLVLGSLTSISTFDLDIINFSIDTDLQALAGDGFFSLSLANDIGILSDGPLADNLLLVNFTPVPEPSTYALFGLGLAIVGWHAWRRRRA
ncbi:autotransporter-associated beta strand repeat-containing protein [Actomonas aquatica]|uniref:PEP-CTERM sorting domain-containing protein n=1 Tax=Actomonas aquatica TaxID=2866162 RepID=A0ABZ1C4G1_9BACT|nr:autotransporter-associated beta strand repeat-containing protein [Opitutus sp. WL0086]WRQ86607.1 PEP-CTERM sorting domain-containing protein [Opitutus sp. WL0086]